MTFALLRLFVCSSFEIATLVCFENVILRQNCQMRWAQILTGEWLCRRAFNYDFLKCTDFPSLLDTTGPQKETHCSRQRRTKCLIQTGTCQWSHKIRTHHNRSIIQMLTTHFQGLCLLEFGHHGNCASLQRHPLQLLPRQHNQDPNVDHWNQGRLSLVPQGLCPRMTRHTWVSQLVQGSSQELGIQHLVYL